jgi:hypothetical protein
MESDQIAPKHPSKKLLADRQNPELVARRERGVHKKPDSDFPLH